MRLAEMSSPIRMLQYHIPPCDSTDCTSKSTPKMIQHAKFSLPSPTHYFPFLIHSKFSYFFSLTLILVLWKEVYIVVVSWDKQLRICSMFWIKIHKWFCATSHSYFGMKYLNTCGTVTWYVTLFNSMTNSQPQINNYSLNSISSQLNHQHSQFSPPTTLHLLFLLSHFPLLFSYFYSIPFYLYIFYNLCLVRTFTYFLLQSILLLTSSNLYSFCSLSPTLPINPSLLIFHAPALIKSSIKISFESKILIGLDSSAGPIAFWLGSTLCLIRMSQRTQELPLSLIPRGSLVYSGSVTDPFCFENSEYHFVEHLPFFASLSGLDIFLLKYFSFLLFFNFH
ncbi:hypothetical protein VP01_1258g1 [Puccinia sorghi]|uniref:Uncharacterized protein n=1 Tax=Puccinia sorghi TaxID=27349 RepID=A0A0L6VPI3_9BASI|nr:hypothetical protein VP01_1258g1 [Puccinia sorghi]